MKANPLSGGSSCIEELSGDPFSIIFWLGADGFGEGRSGTLSLDLK